MTDMGMSRTRTLMSPLSRVIIAVSTLSLAACGGTGPVWQGQEVLVEARQTNLERSVGSVSEDNRELKDRFNALERLYVDLVRQSRTQDVQIATLEQKLANFQKDPAVDATLTRMKGEVSTMQAQVKKLEGRVFTVEMSDRTVGFQPTRQPQEAAPTGTAQAGAATDPAPADPNAASAATPVSPKAAAPAQPLFGAHLASYRTKDQVGTGWSSLTRAFGNDLQGLTPLVYVQNQEGIGTFLRLIVGPMVSEREAESLCERIRRNASEQYCRVSEYQGEPVE